MRWERSTRRGSCHAPEKQPAPVVRVRLEGQQQRAPTWQASATCASVSTGSPPPSPAATPPTHPPTHRRTHAHAHPPPPPHPTPHHHHHTHTHTTHTHTHHPTTHTHTPTRTSTTHAHTHTHTHTLACSHASQDLQLLRLLRLAAGQGGHDAHPALVQAASLPRLLVDDLRVAGGGQRYGFGQGRGREAYINRSLERRRRARLPQSLQCSTQKPAIFAAWLPSQACRPVNTPPAHLRHHGVAPLPSAGELLEDLVRGGPAAGQGGAGWGGLRGVVAAWGASHTRHIAVSATDGAARAAGGQGPCARAKSTRLTNRENCTGTHALCTGRRPSPRRRPAAATPSNPPRLQAHQGEPGSDVAVANGSLVGLNTHLHRVIRGTEGVAGRCGEVGRGAVRAVQCGAVHAHTRMPASALGAQAGAPQAVPPPHQHTHTLQTM